MPTLKEWQKVHPNFTEELKQEWVKWFRRWNGKENENNAYQAAQDWITAGLVPQEFKFVKWLENKEYIPNEERREPKWDEEEKQKLFLLNQKATLKWEYLKDKWAFVVHPDFAKKDWRTNETYQQHWEKNDLTYQDAQQWIQAGFKPNNYYSAKQWKNHHFTLQEAKYWRDIGLRPNEYKFASYLRQSYLKQNNINSEQYKNKNSQTLLGHLYPNKNQVKIIDLKYLKSNQFSGSSSEDLTNNSPLIIGDYPSLKEIKKDWGQEIPNLTQLTINNCPQLEKIHITSSNLQQLILNNLPNLKELDCWNNNLTNLDLSDCDNLKEIVCDNNKLTQIKLPLGEKLEVLDLRYNNLNQDLSFCKDLVGLKRLKLNNNPFYGSLEPLKNMNKLEWLHISDTDLDSGLEYLPDSLKDFKCSAYYRENAKCQVIFNLIGESPQRLRSHKLWLKQQWIKLDFTEEEIKEWINVSLTINRYEFADHLRRNNYHPNNPNIKEIIIKEHWQDIHQDFNYYRLRKDWESKGFDKEQAQKWINAGLKPKEVNHAKQWRNKKFAAEQTKEWIAAGAAIDDYEFVAWLRDIKNYGSDWITSYKEDYQELSNRFKKYSLCSECNQPNTGEKWCKDCNASHLQENFANWTSNNSQIDKFIQKYQIQATESNKFLEWIPYEQFSEIEHIADGGFGKVYRAKWSAGNVHYWDAENKQWRREKDHYYEDKHKPNKKSKNYREVVLKNLTNSQTDLDFLQETAKHKIIDDWFNNLVPCYGLSQDPQTGNYLMVMKYIEGGDLRKYLKNKNLSFKDKLSRLVNIAQGLKDIHQKDLVHRDFHSGNILSDDIHSFITDLGLCKPVSEVNQEEVYGVLPYMAPEVLRKEGYTPASDIYSWGVVAYELLSGFPPYHDTPHSENLAACICSGLRPRFEVKIPLLLKNLIERCWDADPTKRPTANELKKTLNNWISEVNSQENTEFFQQFKERGQLLNNFISPDYEVHPSAFYTSRRLDFKNLPQPRNSKEINNLIWNSAVQSLSLGFTRLSASEANTSGANNWTNLHPSFTPHLIQAWQKHNFTYEQAHDWINIHSPTDQTQAIQEPEFYAWLRDIKQVDSDWVLNHGNHQSLKQEYQTYQQQSQQTPQILHQSNTSTLK